jgi:hypothetical protein
LRQSSSARCTTFKAAAGLASALIALGAALAGPAHAEALAAPGDADIHLELKPRICTLAVDDKLCQTAVQASWHSARPESLCLIIVGRPEIKRCWESFSEGTYRIELSFADDLTVQLRDADLRQTLASEVLRVIREALHYRHKRRDPWNLFD